MNKEFETYRHLGRNFVAGWLRPEMLDILAVINSAQRTKGISGAAAEIGVHHGLFFIGLKLLQDNAELSVAIDIFGEQELNIDKSGKGNLAKFRKNVQRWSSMDSVVIHQGDSTKLQAAVLQELAGGGVRLFSVDGGHTDSVVYSDMKLAEATLALGGVVFADDVYNQEWPEVMGGTLRYMDQGGRLVPFAIGFNKMLFSFPDYADYYRSILRSHFDKRFLIFVKTAEFASHEVLIIARTPRKLRALASRSQIAKRLYYRIQEWRGR